MDGEWKAEITSGLEPPTRVQKGPELWTTPALTFPLHSVHEELKGINSLSNFSKMVGPTEIKERGKMTSCEKCRGPVSST